jgi:hypothetical protein
MSRRPRYETEIDLAKEGRLADFLRQHFACRFQKMRVSYKWDFAAYSSQSATVIGFCEAKIRGKLYPKMIISLEKWMAGKQLCKETGLPCHLIFSTPAGVYHFSMNAQSFPNEILIAGRKDRGDPDDIEPCVLIPIGTMARISDPIA